MDKIVKLTGEEPVRYYYFDNYMRIIYERLGGHVEGTDTAYYIQDFLGHSTVGPHAQLRNS